MTPSVSSHKNALSSSQGFFLNQLQAQLKKDQQGHFQKLRTGRSLSAWRVHESARGNNVCCEEELIGTRAWSDWSRLSLTPISSFAVWCKRAETLRMINGIFYQGKMICFIRHMARTTRPHRQKAFSSLQHVASLMELKYVSVLSPRLCSRPADDLAFVLKATQSNCVEATTSLPHANVFKRKLHLSSCRASPHTEMQEILQFSVWAWQFTSTCDGRKARTFGFGVNARDKSLRLMCKKWKYSWPNVEINWAANSLFT